MARARNIKPSFFINEELVELPFATRLLFIGLWMLADREGRLEDKPKKIKMSIFPGDEVDVDKALSELAERGFIERYIIDNEYYIQIVNFKKHQKPHQNETPSEIPQCEPNSSLQAKVPSTCNQGSKSLVPNEQALGSESYFLNPDCLIPPIPPPGGDECEGDFEKTSAHHPPPLPANELISLFRVQFPELPQPLPWPKWPKQRKHHLQARWRERPTLEAWQQIFEKIRGSPHLLGQNDRGWRASFDWILKPANWAKIEEGVYEKKSQKLEDIFA